MIIASIHVACLHTDQQVAVGDAQGNLRILEIPRTFAVPLTNEKNLMLSFYQKEHSNMQFSCKRREILKLQSMVNFVQEKNSKEEQDDDKNQKDDNKASDNATAEKTDEEMEAEYQHMLASFKKKLSL